MKHRNVIARSLVLAGALAATATVAGSASARPSWGPSYEHVSTCVQTGVAPGNGYRDMNVRFERMREMPRRVAAGPGNGYRGVLVRLPYQASAPGPGYRDALVRFDGMSSHGNAIATGRCPNLSVW
jgi:hypothetical protein